MYIDSHCHTDLYDEKELAHTIVECKNQNVGAIISNGTNIKTNRHVLTLAKMYGEIKPALGIYPIDALELTDKQIDDEIAFIEQNKDKIISVGEVGIDLKDTTEVKRQEEILVKFIELAQKIDKALTIHSRKAEKECIELLEEHQAKKVLMHHFAGKFKFLDTIVANGWYLSIPASVVYATHFQEIVQKVPLENLLAETDSPFLSPNKDEKNFPYNVIASYKKIAEIKGISLKEVEEQLEQNYKKLFL